MLWRKSRDVLVPTTLMNLKSFTLKHLAFALAILISNRSALSHAAPPQQQSDQWGLFEAHADVGDNPRKGAVTYNADGGEYRITGGGANIWAAVDAFQFVWKRFSGDVSISADIHFIGTGAVDHRKAVLMIRQSLDPGSPYADVALHGDGLTALQYRLTVGTETLEVRSEVNGPVRIRMERRGDQFTMFAGKPGENLTASAPVTIKLQDPIYIGLGVCSHDANVLETAVFSNVSVEKLAPAEQSQNPSHVRSKISIYDVESKSIQVVYTADKLWEAPNWSPDGKYLLTNSGGVLYRFTLDASGKAQPEKLALDAAYECNNDHGITRDGKLLAFSADYGSSQASRIFVASPDGAKPRLLTPNSPSYFHGWSPDGKWLAFVGERGKHFNIFRIPVDGGAEQRLTSSPVYDDGPDYSPDGKWIYINSDRSGGWDIWRFPANGAGQSDGKAERVTRDELEDWFPHPSPDGQWLVFLSFPKGTPGHDVKTNVQLRMMPMPRSTSGVAEQSFIQVLTQFFGGQGTINVNSWSPDSKQFAFVSYELLP
jgi:Tol biopolymer transport system component